MEQYIKFRLPNGLPTALLPTKSKVVYCGFAIRSGSRDDIEGYEGLAHFVEHMLFKGTKHRKAWHILNRMELVGGELNAYTTKEETFIYTAAPRRELVRSVELLADLIWHATFPQHELERERIVVADEINLYKDTPSEQIFDDFEGLLFEGHPIGHPILGDRSSLEQMTSETCHAYATQAFQPDQMLFFCMGNVTEARFKQVAESYLAAPFSRRVDYKRRSAEGWRVPAFQKRIPSQTFQAHTIMGGWAPAMQGEGRVETSFLLSILAGSHMNARLNLLLREKKGWVYNVEGGHTALSDIGWWHIYFGSDPQHAEMAVETIYKELQRIKEERLTPTALRAWIKQIKGQLALATEQSEHIFLNFGRRMLYNESYLGIKELYEELDKISIDRVGEVAEQIFDESQISLLMYEGQSIEEYEDK